MGNSERSAPLEDLDFQSRSATSVGFRGTRSRDSMRCLKRTSNVLMRPIVPYDDAVNNRIPQGIQTASFERMQLTASPSSSHVDVRSVESERSRTYKNGCLADLSSTIPRQCVALINICTPRARGTWQPRHGRSKQAYAVALDPSLPPTIGSTLKAVQRCPRLATSLPSRLGASASPNGTSKRKRAKRSIEGRLSRAALRRSAPTPFPAT